VVARYVFAAPIQWTEEMSGFLMIWIVFVGAIACELDDSHLTIDAVTNLCGRGLRRAVTLLVSLASLGLVAYMGWLGWKLANMAAMKKTQILHISWFWLDIAVTVGAVGIAVAILARVLRLVRGGSEDLLS